ncbi:hypothetical protein GcC1_188012 [Golovinomyces cichoracearum]|uniref:Putative zinc-finger domain-containing protein n=1 Tax=Golovinomyces cichoracearum TaxID=62708 RepID=A0A420HJF9_9PEZI|nr:hypothetical protein GcC1_188012 [Golovinomyces cichoracearum]
MAEGPKHSARDKTNLPYFPQYQNQFAHVSNDAYTHKTAAPQFVFTNIAPGAPSLPTYQGWNFDSKLPYFSNPPNDQVYSRPQTYIHQNNTQLYQTETLPAYLPSDPPKNISQNASPESNDAKHNGVLASTLASANHITHQHSGPSMREYPCNSLSNLHSIEESYDDIKTKTCPELMQDSESKHHNLERQQSDSYSPCASPAPLPQNSQKNHTDTHPHPENSSRKQVNPTSEEKNKVLSTKDIQPDHSTNITHGKSIAECKKMARGAILNLWPYGVRLETYLQEGFKKDLVENLFKDLETGELASIEPKHHSNQHQISPQYSTSNNDQRTDEHKLQEQNMGIKDASKAPSETVSKTSQMAEKEKTLKSKMEALRKSREARASAKTVLRPQIDQAIEKQDHKELNEIKLNHNIPVSLVKPESVPNSNASIEEKAKPHLDTTAVTTSLKTSDINKENPDSLIKVAAQSKLPLATPAIPGLFLVTNPTNQAPKLSNENLLKQRKRPIASDFDNSTTTNASFKRPFGHSRNEQRVVIDVSDDESEEDDVPMELESRVDQESPTPALIKAPSFSQNLQLSTKPSGQKALSSPPHAGTHLSSASLTQPLSAPSILKQKQREIQLMKKKIAAAEAQLKAKSTTSSVGTPQQSDSGFLETKDNLCTFEDSSINTEAPQTKSETNNLLAEQERSLSIAPENLEELPRALPKDKKLRLRKIADELPLIDSEVRHGKSRLEQLRNEIAKVEAGLKKSMEERKKMAIELERLDQEPNCLDSDVLTVQAEDSSDTKLTEIQHEVDSTQPELPIEKRNIRLENPYSSEQSQSHPDPNNVTLTTSSAINIQTDKSNETRVLVDDKNSPQHDYNIEGTKAANQELKDALQVAIIAEAEMIRDAKMHEKETKKRLQLEFSNQGSDPAEGSMEEGELSSDYTPEFTVLEGPEGESDNYEPPDATVPDQTSPEVSPPLSSISPKSVNQVKDDQIQNINPKSPPNDAKKVYKHDLSRQNDAVVLPSSVDKPIAISHLSEGFTPYTSALKIFHAYRFHPNFKSEVSGGLRSITYSHKIDEKKEFCRFEIAGGICNDSACDLQHFKSITLPDDGIMAALGCPDEFTGDRRDKFVAGLREVLLDLRLRKINDFDTIASEIIAHRAKFLGDDSKVLALEDITI